MKSLHCSPSQSYWLVKWELKNEMTNSNVLSFESSTDGFEDVGINPRGTSLIMLTEDSNGSGPLHYDPVPDKSILRIGILFLSFAPENKQEKIQSWKK